MSKSSKLHLKDLRLLLVEDEQALRDVMTELIGLLGATVTACSGGFEAIEQLKIHNFDLVLSDVRMPEGTGQDLLTFMNNEMKQRPPIILLSGHSEVSEYLACQMGVASFLVKPISLSILEQEILKCLTVPFAKAN